MAKLILKKCRLAIQMSVGRTSRGRERHRTLILNDVNPDAGADALAEVVRAIEPLLAFPITEVRRVAIYELEMNGGDGSRRKRDRAEVGQERCMSIPSILGECGKNSGCESWQPSDERSLFYHARNQREEPRRAAAGFALVLYCPCILCPRAGRGAYAESDERRDSP
jgi:hypothetical protein